MVSIVRAELARQQAEAAGANEAEMQMAAADERARTAWSNTMHCKSRMVQGGRNEQIPSGALADALADGGYGGEGGSFHAVGFEWEYFKCKQQTAKLLLEISSTSSEGWTNAVYHPKKGTAWRTASSQVCERPFCASPTTSCNWRLGCGCCFWLRGWRSRS